MRLAAKVSDGLRYLTPLSKWILRCGSKKVGISIEANLVWTSRQRLEPHGKHKTLWASRLSWSAYGSIKAEIAAWRLRTESQGWDFSLHVEISSSRLRFDLISGMAGLGEIRDIFFMSISNIAMLIKHRSIATAQRGGSKSKDRCLCIRECPLYTVTTSTSVRAITFPNFVVTLSSTHHHGEFAQLQHNIARQSHSSVNAPPLENEVISPHHHLTVPHPNLH